MAVEDQLLNVILNYGMAGIILYVFYRLFSNELKELRSTIQENTRKLEELITLLRERLK